MIRKTSLFVAIVALSLVNLTNAQDRAQAEPGGGIQGYYSTRLKGHFQIRDFYLPAYGNFRAARIASLDHDSPLRDAGLMAGDVVTRLDGTPLHSNAELDRNAYDTGVRFIKSGSQYAVNREIYVPARYTAGYPSGGESP